MKYRVRIGIRAKRDVISTMVWIAEDSEPAAIGWYDGIKRAILTLAQFPERCPIAPENGLVLREIRQLLHGRGRSMYRVLFTIQEKTVHVLAVRHGARDFAKPGELDLS